MKSLLLYKPGIFNIDAVPFYLTFNFIPYPETFVKQVKKIPPGHFMKICRRNYELFEYWQPKYDFKKRNEDFWNEKIRKDFEETIKKEIISDVPIGTFLSGGLDSSAIVHYLKKIGFSPINTFTFSTEPNDPDFKQARFVAEACETNHVEKIIDTKSVEKIMPEIIWHLEEPFENGSAIHNYFAAKEARKKVKVCFSGDGADELFGGYNYTLAAIGNLNKFKLMLDSHDFKRYFYYKYFVVNKNFSAFFRSRRVFHNRNEWKRLYEKNNDVGRFLKNFSKEVNSNKSIDKGLMFDLKYELPEIGLLRSDKINMAYGLELRVPFLNKRMAEIGLSIPSNLKIKNNERKYMLKRAFEKELSEKIVYRKKRGWGVIDQSLKKEHLGDIIANKLAESEIINLLYKKNILKNNNYLTGSNFGDRRNIRKYQLFTLHMCYENLIKNQFKRKLESI
jgi:asparagine synthase (glutamine-hydrolysing)